ncbi:hypothetical protein CRM22_009526 [Opisthorchis felineus]|uniref:Uncharacterized protein n=1 Tax=Opisthorchis felineus TaxID=147828 RepID=A0A4S2LE95_OPIFE|nr:hypothetical protein CRM22_009526 [Opisthorchis felineus]
MTKKKPPLKRPVSTNPEQGDEDESIYLKLSDIPYDLMRFNISMKKGTDRREARKALLLRMGAAPPKKQFINYKQLMRDKAESKAKAALLPVDVCIVEPRSYLSTSLSRPLQLLSTNKSL